jgi:nitroreductase
MKTFDAISQRRSVRKYKDKKIPAKIVENILRAGMSAPSAHNEQPWRFIVVENKEKLLSASKISPYAGMAAKAPLAILVCCDTNFLKTEGFWPQDLSAAIQNMLLASVDLGLGAVWTGVYPREELIAGHRKLFSLPENIIPFAFIVFGYPDEEIKIKDRFKKDRINYFL